MTDADHPGAVRRVSVRRVESSDTDPSEAPKPTTDEVAVERVVALSLNGRTIVRMSCLPVDLEDLAVGFLASEGLIGGFDAIHELGVASDEGSVEVRAGIDPDRLVRFLERLAASSGCGGGSSSEPTALPRVASEATFRPADLSARMRDLAQSSALFRSTGGVHAAAVAGADELAAVAEDIGRHNAADKCIGRCLRAGIALDDKALLSTGRASADILAKAARAGVPVVVSRGAVTSRAIELAEAANVAAVGFARSGRMNVYTAAWRLGLRRPGSGGEPR